MLINKIEQFTSHMEFLGYEVEQSDEDRFVARHSTYGNVITRPYQGGVLFQQYWVFDKLTSSKRNACLDAVNELNSGSNVTTYVVASDDTNSLIRMDACYLGAYDKKTFGTFLELYNVDSGARVIQNDVLNALIS